MKVLVCGGRDYGDRKTLFEILNLIHTNHPIRWIIQGGAEGADSLAGEWATANRVHNFVFRAKWNIHGLAAGMIRNREMLLANPDLVIAFPGGRGTANMARISVAAGKDVVVVGEGGSYHGPKWPFELEGLVK